MAAAKYHRIYEILRERIEHEEYPPAGSLPSEHTLIEEFDCSRNTIRRAIQMLAENGYVQSIQGKGVTIIYSPKDQSEFIFGEIESLKEAATRNRKDYTTKILCFAELTVDDHIHRRTSFPVGKEIYYIQRIRYLGGTALIIDHNYFLRDVIKNLTPEIAEGSIYDYMEHKLGEKIVTTKRRMTVEHMNQIDEKYMDMKDYNCLAVVSSWTYNGDGIMFEFTQSRHRPDKFAFYEQAQRLHYPFLKEGI